MGQKSGGNMGVEVELLEAIRRIERNFDDLNDTLKKIARILVMLVEVEEAKIIGKEEISE